MTDERAEGHQGIQQSLAMPHSRSSERQLVVELDSLPQPVTAVSRDSLVTRAGEQPRVYIDHVSSMIEEIRPLLEHTGLHPDSLVATLLNIERLHHQLRGRPSDSYVINLEDEPTDTPPQAHSHHHHHQTTATDNFLNNMREAVNAADDTEGRNNNNSAEENVPEMQQTSRAAYALLKVLQRYLPFMLILLVKGIYDHRTGILNLVLLYATFVYANINLKREIAKQHNRSWLTLLLIVCFVTACIAFVHAVLGTHIIFPYTQPLTLWDLLWSVLITDFVLKLVTIIFKVILTSLPVKLLAFQNRGKYYLMVEATSQLYRCIAPVQSWLYYLFEAYQGSEKILGIFLSVVYTVSKGGDLLSRVKLFRTAFKKMLQNTSLGVIPSKEQLAASGGICAICHEEYTKPIRLHCKHIFCEICVSTWLDRERSCPLCRAPITDDPIYRDGHTTHFVQLY